jgi:hypothetical protein
MRYKMKGGGENMHCTQEACCSGPRHFMTNAEKIEMLKEYQDSLTKELLGVKERIETLEEE